ncbi:HesA/MoeB/ThiF family protein [Algoriphagus sp.]|uniref:HesA/MoeB/ThiF family protein n=1 Tax=Algoriphagus sp. TaxID=1872435 RepID=UPI00261DBD45|nr:HesA/MoeB/ThiF family protein [Algoriphagus sp.]
MDRFERQVILPGLGKSGQDKLRKASVLVIGAGGLGCPVLLYLAAAGVGRIGVVDGDEVSLSNLNRQVLFGEKDLGKNKAEQAVAFFQNKYSDINWFAFPEFITVSNAAQILKSYDLIIDGSDNFPTRYLVNDACVLARKPLVFGAIYQHEGQVAIFNIYHHSSNYRDLYPTMPSATEIPNCAQTGVIGVLPGIIGNLMALEAIKWITGLGKVLDNKVLFFNSLSSETYTVEVSPQFKSRAAAPLDWEAYQAMNYELACEGIEQLEWDDAFQRAGHGTLLVDVREPDELPPLVCSVLFKAPLSDFSSYLDQLGDAEAVFFFCQSGIRSQKAALQFKAEYPDKTIFSIRGGINALKTSQFRNG